MYKALVIAGRAIYNESVMHRANQSFARVLSLD
jgi:hypothetical protein